MTRFLRRALCATAPFALLPATAAYAAPAGDTAAPAVAEDFALPDAPTLTVGPNDCSNSLVRRPVLLRKIDLPDLDGFEDAALLTPSGQPGQPALDARPLMRIETLDPPITSDSAAGAPPQPAAQQEDACDNGVMRANVLQPVAPARSHPRA